MNCKNCRNLIDTFEDATLCCEVHPYGRIKNPEKCRAFLSVKCSDESKIERNEKIVDDLRMEAQERILEG